MSPITHILFDFFGTLVSYSPSRTEQGYRRSHALVRDMGSELSYEEFLTAWSTTSARFDLIAASDDREVSMTDIGAAFLHDTLAQWPSPAETDRLVDTYLAEWNTGVHYLPGVADMLLALTAGYRLAVVSNTSNTRLVPGHLESMGVRHLFDEVVLSIDVGWRKPHPTIYASALGRLGIDAASAVFVGDTLDADYHGSMRAGIRSFLIDPHRTTPIPDAARLSSILELPTRLAASAR